MELMTMGSEATGTGLTWGLVVAALLLGLRHGIDWDHIPAITDMTASENSPRRGFRLGTMYVLGHAAAVLALGTVIIFVGLTLPDWVDALMGKVVGVTLVALGVYVVVSLIRDKGQFRPRSRWMVLIGFVRWLRSRLTRRTFNVLLHHHQHAAVRDFHHQSDGAGPRLRPGDRCELRCTATPTLTPPTRVTSEHGPQPALGPYTVSERRHPPRSCSSSPRPVLAAFPLG